MCLSACFAGPATLSPQAGTRLAHDGRGAVQDGDAVAIFNFRADRVLEISRAFEYETFDKFDRKRHPKARAPPVGPACTAVAAISPEWIAACAWGRCALRG